MQDGKAIYPGVGYLRPKKRNDLSNPNVLGTAWLQPDDKIITAAHVLYDKRNNAPFDIFTVYFGRTEPSKYVERATGNIADCQIPPEYAARPFSNARKAYDWALCPINRAEKNDDVQPFQLAASPANQEPVVIVGYTSSKRYPDRFKDQFPLEGTPFMATCDARFYFGNSIPVPNAQPEGDFFWGYECDISKGQSGAPVIANGGVIGSHWGSYGTVPLNLATNLVNRPDGAFSVPANS